MPGIKLLLLLSSSSLSSWKKKRKLFYCVWHGNKNKEVDIQTDRRTDRQTWTQWSVHRFQNTLKKNGGGVSLVELLASKWVGCWVVIVVVVVVVKMVVVVEGNEGWRRGGERRGGGGGECIVWSSWSSSSQWLPLVSSSTQKSCFSTAVNSDNCWPHMINRHNWDS